MLDHHDELALIGDHGRVAHELRSLSAGELVSHDSSGVGFRWLVEVLLRECSGAVVVVCAFTRPHLESVGA